jgi:hypothetical protein
VGLLDLYSRVRSQTGELFHEPIRSDPLTGGSGWSFDSLQLLQPLTQPILVGFTVGSSEFQGAFGWHDRGRYPLAASCPVMHVHTMWSCSEVPAP